MPAFVLLAPKPLSGKTTIAVALAQRLKADGKTVSLSRLGEDPNAAADRALFAAIPGSSDGVQITLTEAPAGESGPPGNRAVVVADAGTPTADIAEFCRSLAEPVVILNRVPARRAAAVKAEAQAAGLKVIGAVPEDRQLASPTLGEVAEALQAEKLYFNSSGQRPLDRTLIASISADPGQGYFVRTAANTVIVRSDKPDLQLAALNAGANAMIITGELPILGYVLNRAEEDTIPLLRTKLETADTVKVIEELYASKPFAGGAEKLRRAAELTAEIDLAALLA